MTDEELDAPERIFAAPPHDDPEWKSGAGEWDVSPNWAADGLTEYIRADLVAAMVREAVQAEREAMDAQAEALGFARMLIDTGWTESDGYRLTYHTSVTMKVMSILDAAIDAIRARTYTPEA
jgi:hypothetical protein